MRGVRNTDRNTRKFISIPDMEKWELIDKLSALPQYQKSFNKIINNALDYGLPMLVKAELGEIKAGDGYIAIEPPEEKYERKEVETYYRLDELLSELIILVEEVIMNATINKSLLCSLFNTKLRELSGTPTRSEGFKSGDFRDTPDYLENYERRAMREINKRRKKPE